MAQVLTTFLNGFEVSGPVTESDFRNYYEGPQFSISFSDEDFEHMIRSVWHVDHAPAKENQQPPRPPALVNEWLVSNYGRRAFVQSPKSEEDMKDVLFNNVDDNRLHQDIGRSIQLPKAARKQQSRTFCSSFEFG